MAQEIEAKILKIDIFSLEQRLAQIGAKRIAEKLFRITTLDYPDLPLDRQAAWVRLRDDGETVTLAYKQRLGALEARGLGKDSGMEEVEITVSDFETSIQFLKKIGMIEKFMQEKKRITWQKGEVVYDIDTWPRLESYLEIEAPTWEEVDAAIKELGFNVEDKVICSATQVYEMAGIRDKDYARMTFQEFIKR